MQILNSLKYASNSSVINTVARVADSGRAVDSKDIGVLKDAIASRGRYFTKAQRMYVLANLDRQYQALNAKGAGVPEAAMIVQELGALKNQISNYARQTPKDSIVKRFRDGVVNVAESVGNGFRGISIMPASAYATAGLVAAVGLATIGVGAGCKDGKPELIEQLRKDKATLVAQVANSKAMYSSATNQTAQVTTERNALGDKIKTMQSQEDTFIKRSAELLDKTERTTKIYDGRIKILEEQLARAGRPDDEVRKEAVKGMVSRKVYEDMQKSYDNKLIKAVAEARSGMVSRAEYNQIKKDNEYSTARLTAVQAEVRGLEARIKKMDKPAAPKAPVAQHVQSPIQKPAPKPVHQKTAVNVPDVREDYSGCEEQARYDIPAAKARALADTRKALDEERKPKMVSFAELNRVPKPGETLAVISGRTITYDRKDVIDLSRQEREGLRVSYPDGGSNTNIVRALPVEKDETSPYRIDAPAPSFSDKNRQTRWERKEAQDKYKKDKNPKKKSLPKRNLWNPGVYVDYTERQVSTESKESFKRAGENIKSAVNYPSADFAELAKDDLRLDRTFPKFMKSAGHFFCSFLGPLSPLKVHKERWAKKNNGLIDYLGGIGNEGAKAGLAGINTTVGLGYADNAAAVVLHALDRTAESGLDTLAGVTNYPRKILPKKNNVQGGFSLLTQVPFRFAKNVVFDGLGKNAENPDEQIGDKGYWGAGAESAGALALTALGIEEVVSGDALTTSSNPIKRVVRAGSKSGGSGGR